jgi:hypothetical protein
MVKILGPTAFINPYTGQIVPPEPTVLELEDINPDYRARAYGSSQMLGKASRQQNYMGLLSAISQVIGSIGPLAPAIITQVNWMALLKEGATLFDFKNLDEIFAPIQGVGTVSENPAAQNVPAGDMGGQLPLDQLNPEVLGTQLGGNLAEFAPTST